MYYADAAMQAVKARKAMHRYPVSSAKYWAFRSSLEQAIMDLMLIEHGVVVCC